VTVTVTVTMTVRAQEPVVMEQNRLHTTRTLERILACVAPWL
jgi:hypothetical protein